MIISADVVSQIRFALFSVDGFEACSRVRDQSSKDRFVGKPLDSALKDLGYLGRQRSIPEGHELLNLCRPRLWDDRVSETHAPLQKSHDLAE